MSTQAATSTGHAYAMLRILDELLNEENARGRIREMGDRSQVFSITHEDQEWIVHRVNPYEYGCADTGRTFVMHHDAYHNANTATFVERTDDQDRGLSEPSAILLDLLFLDAWIGDDEERDEMVKAIIGNADDLGVDVMAVLQQVARWAHYGREDVEHEWRCYVGESGMDREVY